MNRKTLVLVFMAISAVLLAATAKAQGPIQTLTVWTDKRDYAPGESGKLYITYYNDGESPVEIRNITLAYRSWQAYVGNTWVGNQTFVYTSENMVGKDAKWVSPDVTFVVPTDGRAQSTWVDIKVYTNPAPSLGYEYSSIYLEVPETLRPYEQIVTLLTVMTVLLIVCTAIIAAAIFLSARKPQVTWKTEEKP